MANDHNGGNGALLGFINRIERLSEEKKSLQDDIGEIFAEAKNAGFDVKVMRIVLRDRKLTAAEREQRDDLIDAYKHALGMLSDLPLGESALRKVGLGSTLKPGETLTIGGTVIKHSDAR